MFNYLLRQHGLTVQDLHRVKSNSINYALQRRKTRFFISDYKQLLALTLTKARSQLAIKLRQLSFYVQTCEEVSAAKILCEQAIQILLAHKTTSGHLNFCEIKGGKKFTEKLMINN
ncbi:hypothetical protein [Limosilactobacillus reuteri]|uniref:hypothetical protein n=1 Tax=Limosilactobacillus reuteri TaxID=1598 RepID=UPI001CDAEDFB|nr:hypothetical protein [Limosilactobacillus reuteri]